MNFKKSLSAMKMQQKINNLDKDLDDKKSSIIIRRVDKNVKRIKNDVDDSPSTEILSPSMPERETKQNSALNLLSASYKSSSDSESSDKL